MPYIPRAQPNAAADAYYGVRRAEQGLDQGDLSMRTGEFNLGEAERRAGTEREIDTAVRDWIRGNTPGGTPGINPDAPSPGGGAAPGGGAREGHFPTNPSDMAGDIRPPTTGLNAVGLDRARPAMPPVADATRSAGTLPSVQNYPGLPERLAQVRGGGQAALNVMGRDNARRDQMTTQMFQMMEKGNLHQAQYLAKQIGFQLPPEAWADVNNIRQLGQAAKFMPLYANDRASFSAMLRDVMLRADQTGQWDWLGAHSRNPPRSATGVKIAEVEGAVGRKLQPDEVMQVAGVRPAGAAGGGRQPTLRAMQDPDDGEWYWGYPGAGGQAQFVHNANGQRMLAPPPRDNSTAFMKEFGFLVAQGQSPEQAIATLRSRRGPGADEQQFRLFEQAAKQAASEKTMTGRPLHDTPEKMEARIQQILQGGQQARAGAMPPAAPAQPQVPQLQPAYPGRPGALGSDTNPYKVTTPQEHAQLPPGAVFLDPGDGQLYRKR